MKDLEKLSKMKLIKNRIILLILSLVGFFDSAYLTISHYKNVVPPCSISSDCESVLTSRFATILGIPLALFGVLYFLALIFLLLLAKEQNIFPKFFKFLALAGIVASFVLLYLQAFVLHAFCQYCLLVEAIIFLIFILNYSFNSSEQNDKN